MEFRTNPKLILTDLEVRDSTDVITKVAALLYEQGYVHDSFLAAVLEREKVFATGLPTPEVHVAIPHADPEHVIKPGIAIAVLKNPVLFGEMGQLESKIAIQIVCVLALHQADNMVLLLQNLVALFQSPGLLQKILSSNPDMISNLFNNQLSVQPD